MMKWKGRKYKNNIDNIHGLWLIGWIHKIIIRLRGRPSGWKPDGLRTGLYGNKKEELNFKEFWKWKEHINPAGLKEHGHTDF